MKFRKAKMTDVESIHGLINNYANQGLMLARSRNMLYETIREFTVAVDETDQVVGAAALHIIWEDLAEVRALAMDEKYRGQGVGRALVSNLIEEAKELGIFRVFSLTYQQGFFEKIGFHVVTKDELPHKVWKECINCAKFPNCDEIAMVIDL
jgi:amino-acid N-acetyltransferase